MNQADLDENDRSGKVVMKIRPLRFAGLCCGCLVICLVLLFMASESLRSARRAAVRRDCGNHLKQIGLGLQNYCDIYGSFPPAYTVDKDGKPLHSWRVLILPFLESNDIYGRIRLDEPWDSMYNSRFHNHMPPWLACPLVEGRNTHSNGLTSYKMIIGPDTISNGPGAVSFTGITNGLANTIAVLEVVPSTNWMAPVDILDSELPLGIGHSKHEGIGSHHDGGEIAVLMCDGTIRSISKEAPAGTEWLEAHFRIRKPDSGNY